ncbi:MAG TPA: peptidoglycan-binding domain-containing protein [Candidatus Bathyarchaeia archaeon]
MARHSDHNPEPDGTVDARDFTNDPSGGCDSRKLCEAILASRDPRLSYVISNGEIAFGRKGPHPWTWRKYTGANGHYHHAHVSVLDEGQDDKTPWKIESAFKKMVPAPSVTLTKKQVSSVMHLGSKGEFVETLQKNLRTLGYGPIAVDGDFGDDTDRAVKEFQKDHKLKSDGWAGPATLEAVGHALERRKTQPKIDEAESKVAAAKKVVNDAAANGKSVSKTEWLAGLLGAGGTVSVIKQTADTVTETTKSVSDMVVSLGPWILLGAVTASAAGYIIYDRRRKRLEAAAVKKVL